MRVRMAHISMEFSDTPRQKLHDATAIFSRAESRNYAWITGTEAAEDPLKTDLTEAAHNHGYTFAQYKSNWVAAKKSIMIHGSYSVDARTIVDNDLTVGRGPDSCLLWIKFESVQFGHVAVMVGHYPLRGLPDSNDPDKRVNLKWTKAMAHAIGDRATILGDGPGLFFYGGDQNIPDNLSDTFFGEPVTSAGDELHTHPSTGHGPIDVIASYDRDKRVSAVSWRVFPDGAFFLYTDHFLCEAVYEIATV